MVLICSLILEKYKMILKQMAFLCISCAYLYQYDAVSIMIKHINKRLGFSFVLHYEFWMNFMDF